VDGGKPIEWPTCPVREILDDQELTVVRELERASAHFAAPQADGFAAWVVRLRCELAEARASRRESEVG
jgi:hypothetical protein